MFVTTVVGREPVRTPQVFYQSAPLFCGFTSGMNGDGAIDSQFSGVQLERKQGKNPICTEANQKNEETISLR
jgi:hypothetical protein